VNWLRWGGFAAGLVGERASRRAKQMPDLGSRLNHARIPVPAPGYLAVGDLVSLIASLVAFLLGIVAVLVLPHTKALLVGGLAASTIIATYMITQATFLLRPRVLASTRAKSIEINLPYAASFAASFAASGATPREIFHALARESMYGELSAEARWIYRDSGLLGIDIVTALSHAAQRSPSRTYAEFLHGAAYTISTGGDLKTYFMAKASQLAEQARREQRKYGETLAVFSETYVTVAVAGPLFLVVVLSIMTLASNRGGDTLWYLNLVAFALLPLLHGGFALVLKQAKPEA
jgi:archaeal flagellar protein FlaJ